MQTATITTNQKRMRFPEQQGVSIWMSRVTNHPAFLGPRVVPGTHSSLLTQEKLQANQDKLVTLRMRDISFSMKLSEMLVGVFPQCWHTPSQTQTINSQLHGALLSVKQPRLRSGYRSSMDPYLCANQIPTWRFSTLPQNNLQFSLLSMQSVLPGLARRLPG